MSWEYFRRKIASLLLKQKVDISEHKDILETLRKLFEKKDVEKITEIFKKYDLNIPDVQIYKTHRKKDEDVQKIDEDLIQSILLSCGGDKQILYLPKKLNYETSKAISAEIFSKHTPILVFIITENVELDGKITASLYPKEMKSMPLIESYSTKNKENWLEFFGDRRSRVKAQDTLRQRFYLYRFESKDRIYNILTESKIKPQFCKIKGMLVRQIDDAKVGETLRIKTDLDFIFVSDVQMEENNHSKEEIIELTKEWDYEKLASSIFGLHRHPRWFERTYMAWLFSGKYDNYPLHFGVMGKAGTGKTRGMILPLTIQIPEHEPMAFFDGTRSTIKGLVPSFGNDFSEGYFATRRRIAYVDEFLTALKRSSKSIRESEETGMLTTLLEHMPSSAQSGKTKEAIVSATAKMILTTNPKHSLQDIVACAEDLDRPFMSRLLWYHQNEAHVDFINKHKSRISAMPMEERLPKKDPVFLKTFDFLNSFVLPINADKVGDIYTKYVEIIPAGMHEVYMGRYNHHYMCLCDGIAKLRWLLREKDTLDIDEEDYREAEELFATVLSSWGSAPLMSLPLRARDKYLPKPQRNVYEYLCEQPGLTQTELDNIFDASVRHVIERLQSLELVRKHEGKYYPHWHMYVVEKEPQEVDVYENK